MEEEILKYKLTFAENGAILEPLNAAALVYEEDNNNKNPKMCLAIGEEIYYLLYDDMINSTDCYKYDIEIKITPIKNRQQILKKNFL